MVDGDSRSAPKPGSMAERLADVLKEGAEKSPEGKRRRVRRRLLLAGPILLVALALFSYLTGGRYVSTDNAYVQADKILISTDVAGTVAAIAVRNNDRVEAGQLLFKLDDETYRIALRGAEAQLSMVRNEIAALKATYQQKLAEIKQSEADIVFFEREAGRQGELLKGKATSLADWDDARHKLDQARANRISLQQQADSVLAQLGGTADPPVETHARYLQAKAQVDKAERDLRRTSIAAPAAGIVTNVDKLQVGQYLSSAQAAFSLVATDQIWVDANLKETELTHVRAGNPATVTVDTYPGRTWKAVVASISPATGAEFSLLPPQNASGNWVKVVQRVPVRLRVDVPKDGPPLRAGMSVTAEIDTGHRRTLGTLFESIGHWF